LSSPYSTACSIRFDHGPEQEPEVVHAESLQPDAIEHRHLLDRGPILRPANWVSPLRWFAVGSVVPGEAVGAVATQSFANTSFGRD
jgi:hypothetical protein